MVENGVSYVWLLEDKKDDNNGGTVIVLPEKHEHDYRYLETVAPSCDNLGYERWQCDGCGNLDKRNYTKATGHNYKAITIREATCKQGGLKLNLCDKCGSFYEESTPIGEHKYKAEKIQPTCTDKGYTTSTCTMCGQTFVSDYTESTGHNWDGGHSVTSSTCTADGVIEYHCTNAGCKEKMIKAENTKGHTPGKSATCTELQTCVECGVILELPKGHSYKTKTVKPTCTSMGYTVYSCKDCDNTYEGDYIDKMPHNYGEKVTEPTCMAMGYTTYTCADCGDEYVSDYTDKIAHNYAKDVTEPTCTSVGFTTYTCVDCGETYKAGYTDVLPHNYNKKTVEPTCTEHGYAVFTCPDCGKSYIGEYTDVKKHHYTKVVTPPTCTEMGYTTYTCDDCGDSYKADYVDKAAHDYTKTVTAPTCTALGYTVYECKNCDYKYISNYTDKINHSYIADVTEPTCTASGYTVYTCENCGKTYTADYKDMTGHNPSDWIINEPATIEHAGEKHIECLTCGEVLSSAAIPQLVEKDRTDEDGNSKVGDFSILVTNANGKPIFDSEISIDINDNVTIKLPSGRLLDYADQTIITAMNTDSQQPKSELQIFIYDVNNNAATGKTDENGQLKVPNSKTSTGDNSGTVGKDDEDKKNTFVVKATDKMNVVIPNCEVYIGESNNIVVDLPEGIKPTSEYPVIITVTDQHGQPQQGVTVITLGDADYIEKGVTDKNGKTDISETIPGKDTDGDGKEDTEESKTEYNITVEDTKGKIENAYIEIKYGKITVTLPDTHTLTTSNQTTVTVLDKDNKGVANISVTIKDKTTEKTGTTDANGKVTLPVKSSGGGSSSGGGGGSRGNGGGGYISTNTTNITVTDKNGKNVSVSKSTDKDGKITLTLPNGTDLTGDSYYTIKATDNKGNAKADVAIILKDRKNNSANGTTDKNGMLILPASEHKAYIFGYNDGTFRPDNNMSRAEAAAIFARLISEQKGEKISGKSNFNDVSKSEW